MGQITELFTNHPLIERQIAASMDPVSSPPLISMHVLLERKNSLSPSLI